MAGFFWFQIVIALGTVWLVGAAHGEQLRLKIVFS